MLIRRALLPVWCAAFAVAGAFAFTVQVVDPAPGVPGLEARADLPAASQGAICAAQEAVPVEDLLDSTIERRVVCAETLDCGHCCGTHGSLKKFWACCNSGGGLACADACKRY